MESCEKCNYHILKDLPRKYQTSEVKREYYCAEASCFLRNLRTCPLSGKSINPIAIKLQ